MAGSVDSACAVAILGDDPVATAAAAIGMARAQAMHRRVVLIDLLGENSDLSTIVGDPSSPGITDMLEYGVSLRRAAVAIREQPNLFVVPTGIEAPLQPYYLEHRRWTDLAHDFRDAGALLLIVAPALVPMAERLLDRLDGIVIVRGAAVPATSVPTLADVRLSAQYPHTMRRTPAIARARIEVEEPRRSRGLLVALGALSLAVLLWAVWFVRPWSPGVPAGQRSADAAPATAAGSEEESPTPRGIPDAELGRAPSAGWSILLANVNDVSGALMRVSQVVDSMPSATYSPTLPAPGGAWWYRIVVGAFPDSANAAGMLAALRTRGIVGAGVGKPIPTPLALLVADSLLEGEAIRRASELLARNVPAYVLLVSPGRARVYVGAFDNAGAAQSLTASLDSLNFRATLVPRVGSVY